MGSDEPGADAGSANNKSEHKPNRDHSSQRGSGSKHSSRGKPGRGRGGNRGKKRDMGRKEWSKTKPDKRQANNDAQATKRQKLNDGEAADIPVYATKFEEDEIKAEERRPKKKVAVLLGYSGTGYKGMQLAHDQKTIEGDLFKAFVEAGAISKANADDPKKSSFVRCARTDKGVHAAGNIISLKLIVEEEDIVQKINNALTPQIRVWGFERTNNSFSSYQLCDSRIYEYLIPTHSFLPPHPKSFLGKKCREWAERKGETEQWQERQKEVEGFWEEVDRRSVKPILEEYPEDIRSVLEKALWLTAEHEARPKGSTKPKKPQAMFPTTTKSEVNDVKSEDAQTESIKAEPQHAPKQDKPDPTPSVAVEQVEVTIQRAPDVNAGTTDSTDKPAQIDTSEQLSGPSREQRIARRKLIDDGVKRLRAAYVAAKRSYRIPTARRERLESVLQLYIGTRNFWNYTIQKTFRDPSAKRVIKTFVVNPTPILIDGTEWLSLKVHGQSFMMHQIRKLVAMAALIVRCGGDPSLIPDSYGPDNISIPKAPSLGLLLERPVFDSYNKRAVSHLDKKPITFDPYKEEMEAFKQKFIYERMYEDEERDNVFGNFFNHIDNFPSNTFLFVTSGRFEAAAEPDGEETGANTKDEDDGDLSDGGAPLEEAAEDVLSDDEDVAKRDNAGDEG